MSYCMCGNICSCVLCSSLVDQVGHSMILIYPLTNETCPPKETYSARSPARTDPIEGISGTSLDFQNPEKRKICFFRGT
jgi:hypothetical protein